MSDVKEVFSRLCAFKHFRDLNPDKSYTSAEAEDCFTLADEITRLRAEVERLRGLLREARGEIAWRPSIKPLLSRIDAALSASAGHPATLSEFVRAPDSVREDIGNEIAPKVWQEMERYK